MKTMRADFANGFSARSVSMKVARRFNAGGKLTYVRVALGTHELRGCHPSLTRRGRTVALTRRLKRLANFILTLRVEEVITIYSLSG